ncbi:MAG: hypothetical protein H8E64_01320 [Candidatus Marinimicrobia bacterium]|nr:hypothetical protein [Candidatus Neomarinimicrobiota bacterium]
MNTDICCPEFDPSLWEENTHEWEKKAFIQDQVCTLFYIPINFGTVMKRLDKRIANADSSCPDGLCLSEHQSKWKMDVFLAVDKEIPGANNVTLSGKYFSKVYEGPYKNTGKWCEDFDTLTKKNNLNIGKKYTWYTTCPKCAKKYGKNYVVYFGEFQ